MANVEFIAGDAARHQFPVGAFDAIVSRFGVMFFDDPVAAFTNLHRALRVGGRLEFECYEPGRGVVIGTGAGLISAARRR